MNYISKFGIIALLIFSIIGCKNTEENTSDNHASEEDVEHHDEGHISLTQVQEKDAGIVYGTFSQEEIQIPIEVNGTIELPPNNMASISAILDGFIVKINFLEGDMVKKGQVLVELKDPGYVKLQQEYLSLYGRFQFLEQEKERQQILSNADVGAKKNLQQAQSEYKSANAQLNALKQQLNYLGISTNAIENGNIQTSISLRAPFDGTVTTVQGHSGEFIAAGTEIMQVINREHMHLELQLFQKDIPNVKKGQKVTFSIPAFEDSPEFQGEVNLVGKNLEMDSKTIRIHAHFDENLMLLPGLYAEAKIMQAGKRARVLPTTAIITDKGTSYFFIKTEINGNEIGYEKVAFEPGISNEEFIQIKSHEKVEDTTAIVLKGAFTLKAAMNKAKGGHQD